MQIINYRYFCLNILEIVERSLNPYNKANWTFYIDEQSNCEISCLVKTPHLNTSIYITLKINDKSVKLHYGFGELNIDQLEYCYDKVIDINYVPNTNDDIFVNELKTQIPKAYAKTCVALSEVVKDLLLRNLGDLINDN